MRMIDVLKRMVEKYGYDLCPDIQFRPFQTYIEISSINQVETKFSIAIPWSEAESHSTDMIAEKIMEAIEKGAGKEVKL